MKRLILLLLIPLAAHGQFFFGQQQASIAPLTAAAEPPAAPSRTNYPLNYVTNAYVAWSVSTALDSNYAGNLVRVRRSSDDAESDFGLNASNYLDTASLLTWAGTDVVYVTNVYDQSGGSINLYSPNTAWQPVLASNGVIRTDVGGIPSMQFDGSNDRLFAGPYLGQSNWPVTLVAYGDVRPGGDAEPTYLAVSATNNATHHATLFVDGGVLHGYTRSTAGLIHSIGTSPATNARNSQVFRVLSSTTNEIYLNGVFEDSTTGSANIFPAESYATGWSVGCLDKSVDDYFMGGFTDTQIYYERLLTTNEIAQLDSLWR